MFMGASLAHSDLDEVSGRYSSIVFWYSHRRLKTAWFLTRAATALWRTGGVSPGALLTSTRGREVDPGGLPKRGVPDGAARLASPPTCPPVSTRHALLPSLVLDGRVLSPLWTFLWPLGDVTVALRLLFRCWFSVSRRSKLTSRLLWGICVDSTLPPDGLVE